MKVILISGKAQHGKDTIANFAKEYLNSQGASAVIVHYADYMKFIAMKYFDWRGVKDDVGRSLLQYLGTDLVRKIDENFWVDTVVRLLTVFGQEWDYVLIPDTRFPNEIERIVEAGLDVDTWRVVRTNFETPLSKEQQKHASEVALDGYKFNHVVVNEGNLEELGHKVRGLLERKVD